MHSKSKGSKEILSVFFMDSCDDVLEASKGSQDKKDEDAEFYYLLQNWFHE